MTDSQVIESSVEVKFPSNMNVVGAKSYIKFLECLKDIPDKFDKDSLASMEGFPVKHTDSLGRMLSYLRYLGFVNEQRVGDDKKQLWALTEKSLRIKKALHFDPSTFKDLLKVSVKDTELYRFLANLNEIKNYNKIKISMLDNVIFEQQKGNPDKAKMSRKFMMSLFNEVGGIIITEGDVISLDNSLQVATGVEQAPSAQASQQPPPTPESKNLVGSEGEVPPPGSESETGGKRYFASDEYNLFVLKDFNEYSLQTLVIQLKKICKERNIQYKIEVTEQNQ